MRSFITRALFGNINMSYFRGLSHGRVSSKRLQLTEKAVEECRSKINTHKPVNYGFVSMPAVPCAHAVAELLEHQQLRGAKIILTPKLKDIVSGIIPVIRVLSPW